MACRPGQHGARYAKIVVLAGRAGIDGPGFTHFGFKVRKLFKCATAHRSINKSHLIVLHLSVKKFDQLSSANRVDQYCAVSDRTTLRSHPIARATDLETNHTLGAKRVEQRLGISGVIAQISDNDSVVIVTAINRRKCACARTSIKTLRQFLQLFYAKQSRPEPDSCRR